MSGNHSQTLLDRGQVTKTAVGCNRNRLRYWAISDDHASCMATGLVQKNSNQLSGYEFASVLAMLKIGSLVKELLGASICLITCYCHSFLFIPLGRHLDPLNDVLADPLM